MQIHTKMYLTDSEIIFITLVLVMLFFTGACLCMLYYVKAIENLRKNTEEV